MIAKHVAAILLETTPNVREVDMTGAKPVYAEGDVLIPDLELTRIEKKPLASFSGFKLVNMYKAWGAMKFTISRSLPLDVTNFDGSDIDILLRCSGKSRTPIYQTPGDNLTPIVGYSYMPQTGNTSTMSVDVIGEDHLYQGHAGKCALKLTAKAGEELMVEFSISAAFDEMLEAGPYSVPFLTPPTSAMLDENDIYGNVKLGATVGTATRAQIDEVMIDMGSEVVQKKTFAANKFRIKDFWPTVSLKGDVDVENPYSVDAVVDGTAKALLIQIKDKSVLSVPGDLTTGKVKWEIIVPSMTPDNLPKLSEQEGLGYLDQTFKADPTVGNDNIEIRYYI